MQSRYSDDEAKRFVDRYAPTHGETLAMRTYTARLLGADASLVLHGGGNTSAKGTATLFAGTSIEEHTDVLFIKGSGSDLATIEPSGHPAVRLAALVALRRLETLGDDAMVAAQRSLLIDPTAPNPSIECLLHAFLPHRFVDHTHADAILMLADQPDAERVCRDLFGAGMVFVPYVMPGFLLAKACAAAFDDKGERAELIVLERHGLFTFGGDAKTAYERTIDAVTRAEQYVQGRRATVACSESTENSSADLRRRRAIAPILRGSLARAGGPSILAWDTSSPARTFVDDERSRVRSQIGPATPDHVIRTRPWPALVDRVEDGAETSSIRATVDRAIAAYGDRYRRYVDEGIAARGPRVRLDGAPRLLLVPGIGFVAAGASRKDADVAREIYAHTIDVIDGAFAAGDYRPVAPLDLFDLEYWPLEQAKLGKAPKQSLDGKIALITGAASGIGLATASMMLAKGAHVVLVDREQARLTEAESSLGAKWKGRVACAVADVTKRAEVDAAFDVCVDAFGGVDIVVSNAGTAPQGLLHEEAGDAALRRSLDENLLSHQHVARRASELFLAQGIGGALLFNASKAAFAPGPAFGPYAIAKAATIALMRQYAIDLASHGVRTGAVNADRIRTRLFGEGVLEARAKARGLEPEAYFKANMLGREVTADDVAEAFVYLATAKSTTGCVMTVDGGNAAAFPR